MHTIYKRTILVLSIASITACTQYKTDERQSNKPQIENKAIDLELAELDKVVTTVAESNY